MVAVIQFLRLVMEYYIYTFERLGGNDENATGPFASFASYMI